MNLSIAPTLALRFSIAETDSDIATCQSLISDTYLRDYGVEMTPDRTDPNGGIERLPDRLLMATDGGEVVACSGLYLHKTYVEEFGHITDVDLNRVLQAAGVSTATKRPTIELTKAVVRRDYRKRGLGRLLLGMSHSRVYMDVLDAPPVLLLCGKVSILQLWRVLGIRTRRMSEFPTYRNHARYRQPDDPVESHIVIPEIDIHPRWYDMTLPTTITVDVLGGIIAD